MTGETLYAGNREPFRSAFLKTHPKYKKQYPLLLGDPRFRHLSVIELKSPAEADRLLNEDADPHASRAVARKLELDQFGGDLAIT